MDPNDPEPQVPQVDPTSPSNTPQMKAYYDAMAAWLQRETERVNAARGQAAPAPAPSFFDMFKPKTGGRSRRSKSKRSKRSKSRRR